MIPPNPGSDEARKAGCNCAMLDNEYGRGYMGIAGVFCLRGDCPIHAEDFREIEAKSKIVEVKPPKRKGSELEEAWLTFEEEVNTYIEGLEINKAGMRKVVRDLVYTIVNSFPHGLNDCRRCEITEMLKLITKEK